VTSSILHTSSLRWSSWLGRSAGRCRCRCRCPPSIVQFRWHLCIWGMHSLTGCRVIMPSLPATSL